MFPNVPTPRFDQTIRSLVALLMPMIGQPATGYAIAATLGRQNANALSSIPGARASVLNQTSAVLYASHREFIAGHSYLPFFRPFIEAETYESMISATWTAKGGRGSKEVGAIRISRWPKYCDQCALEDINACGLAYARRAHQFEAVNLCYQHASPLRQFRGNGSDKLAEKGVIIGLAHWRECAHALQSIPARGELGWSLNFAKFVAAAVQGAIEPAPPAVRKATFASRIREKFASGGSTATALTQAIVDSAGLETLSTLGLDLQAGRTANWPVLLLGGSTFDRHPTAALIAMAALFDGPDDYREAISRAAPAPRDSGGPKDQSRGVPMKLGLTLSMIRDLLRIPSLRIIASRHGLNRSAVKDRLQGFPELARRRREALHRQRLRAARRELRRFVEANPNGGRKDFWLQHGKAAQKLLQFDRAWYDEQLPGRAKNGRPHPECGDDRAIDAIRSAVLQLRQENEHLRVCAAHLVPLIPTGFRTGVQYGRLRSANRFLRSVSESHVEYVGRCTARLHRLLQSGNVREAKEWTGRVLEADPRLARVMGAAFRDGLSSSEAARLPVARAPAVAASDESRSFVKARDDVLRALAA